MQNVLPPRIVGQLGAWRTGCLRPGQQTHLCSHGAQPHQLQATLHKTTHLHTQHAATQQTLLQHTPAWALMHTPQPPTHVNMRQASAGHAHAAQRIAALQPSQRMQASMTAAPSITYARRDGHAKCATHTRHSRTLRFTCAKPGAGSKHGHTRATAQCRTNLRAMRPTTRSPHDLGKP